MKPSARSDSSAPTAWLRLHDGALSPKELADLEADLRASPELRREFAEFQVLATALHDRLRREAYAPAPSLPRTSWIKRALLRPAIGIAAGIALGIGCTTLVFAFTAAATPTTKTIPLQLVDGSFESGIPMAAFGMPAQPGHWSGDFSDIVEAENGISPAAGSRMLRFLRADNAGKPTSTLNYVGEAAQIIDVRPYRVELRSGQASAEISAAFNSIPLPAGHKESFEVKLAAFRGDMVDGRRFWTDPEAAFSRAQRSIVADSDPATWQRIAVQIPIPEDTDFIMIQCATVRREPRLTEGVATFAGQYVDDVEVTLQFPTNKAIASLTKRFE
jgi:hypothetical protein